MTHPAENDAEYRDELDDHIAESMLDPEYAAAPTWPLDQMGDPDDDTRVTPPASSDA